jgi:hypothetical protein
LRSNAIHRRIEAANQPNQQDDSSSVIVPLPYQATRNSSKTLIDHKNHLTNDRRLKAIILHKAAAAYFCLVDRNEKEKNYGNCLRYLRLALNCYSTMLKHVDVASYLYIVIYYIRCTIQISIDRSEYEQHRM